VNVAPEGSGTVGVNGVEYKSPVRVPDNSTVSFRAKAAKGYRFVCWDEALSGDKNPTTYHVTCNTKVTAVFEPVPQQ